MEAFISLCQPTSLYGISIKKRELFLQNMHMNALLIHILHLLALVLTLYYVTMLSHVKLAASYGWLSGTKSSLGITSRKGDDPVQAYVHCAISMKRPLHIYSQNAQSGKLYLATSAISSSFLVLLSWILSPHLQGIGLAIFQRICHLVLFHFI